MPCEQISTIVKMLMYLLLHSLRCNIGITGLSNVSAISLPIGRWCKKKKNTLLKLKGGSYFMCLNKLFPSKRLIIQHSTFSFNGASYIIRTFHVIDKSRELPKQTRSPPYSPEAYHKVSLSWPTSCWVQAHISLNHRRPFAGDKSNI